MTARGGRERGHNAAWAQSGGARGKGCAMQTQIAYGKARLIGGLMLLVGVGFTVWMWQMALSEHRYYVKASILFPASAVLGLWILLYPQDTRLEPPEGVSTLQKIKAMPVRWRVALIIALLLGFANVWLISRPWVHNLLTQLA